MIYDVRQSTTYAYASPVAHARHVLRQMPINRNGQRVQVAALQIGPEPQRRREGQDFFGNRLTRIDVEAPHQTLTVKLTARVSVDALNKPDPCAKKPSPPAISGRPRPHISYLQAAWSRSILKSATTRKRASRPDARCSTAPSNSCIA
jgi:transglutaminase-like putative cysteine protease